MKDKEYWINWTKAAGVRAVKTAAQTAAAAIGTTATMGGVNWAIVGSTALLSGILSLITSLGGLPEVEPTSTTTSTNA
jgi:Ni,Fe-hydrogenase I small subunit